MLSDDEIIQSCKKDSAAAQRILYARYAPLMKGVCIRYVRDRELASDILHDAFMKIFKSIHHFQGKGSLEGWIRRIVVNTSLDYLRKAKSVTSLSIQSCYEIDLCESEKDAGNDDSIIQQLLDAGFNKEFLIQILHQLPANYSAVFNMFYIDNMTHREIARVLQISESLSKQWTFRAKGSVRKHLMSHLQGKIKITYGRGR